MASCTYIDETLYYGRQPSEVFVLSNQYKIRSYGTRGS